MVVYRVDGISRRGDNNVFQSRRDIPGYLSVECVRMGLGARCEEDWKSWVITLLIDNDEMDIGCPREGRLAMCGGFPVADCGSCGLESNVSSRSHGCVRTCDQPSAAMVVSAQSVPATFKTVNGTAFSLLLPTHGGHEEW